MKRKFFSISGLLIVSLMVSLFSGCSGTSSEAEVANSINEAISEVNSVETSILIDLQARIGSTGSSDGHSASLGSDITIVSNFDTDAYHAEYYSRINVDGVNSKEDMEYYVIKEDEDYIRYECDGNDEWTKSTISVADRASLYLKSGVLSDWSALLANCSLENNDVEVENRLADEYMGTVRASIIQELIGDSIFNSFMYSVEQILNDEIPCTVYIDSETSLPVQIILDFKEDFMADDMIFDVAQIVVTYSDWGEAGEVTVPKKISIVAVDEIADYYSSFFAWQLFLPYVNGNSGSSNHGSAGLNFASSWNTYQIRIDDQLTTIPFTYEDLNNLGYTIDSSYNSTLIEPNKYIDNVAIYKGKDIIYCTLYNPETKALPITSCSIGCVDISSSDQKDNSIKVYLPGEITLGITEEALKSAYGDPNEVEHAFACDSYIWTTDNHNQSFMAEISPTTKQVIRLQLKNIPVKGGKQ